MTARLILIPNPDHPITIKRNPNRITVFVHPPDEPRSAMVRAGDASSVLGHPPDALRAKLADTVDALTLSEANYPPVHYIPRAAVDLTQLRRSTHATYCPYKGDASYFDIPALGDKGANAVWTYEQPYPAVAEIAGHLAFYPVVEITEAAETDA